MLPPSSQTVRSKIISKPSHIYISTCLVVAVLGACSPRPQTADIPSPALVTTVQDGAAQSLIVSGQVRATMSPDVATEYGGRVVSLRANVGDRVVAGQVLAELDTSVVGLQSAQAQAQLRLAAADLDAAQREADRLKKLVAAGAASSQDLDNAETALRRAEAQRQAAAAQTRLSARALDKSQVRAPTAGVIAARQVELGAVLPAGAPLFSLDGGGAREIQAQLPGQATLGLRAGDLIGYSYGSIQGQARVIGLAERVAGVDAFAVRLGVVSGAPPAGASVQLRFAPRTTEKGASVPLSAILTDRSGQRRVIALDAEGATRSVPVKILNVTASGALVQGALSAGQPIVAAGGEFLKAGERVRALPFTR